MRITMTNKAAIVVALVALILSAVALMFSLRGDRSVVPSDEPDLFERVNRNEVAAIRHLRAIAAAQEEFRRAALIDGDQDGRGEYGGFIELSGEGVGRIQGVVDRPFLSGAFRVLEEEGAARTFGYWFRVFLPADDGAPVGEPQGGYRTSGLVDGEGAERAWCAYAWPVNYNLTGNRTFFINQVGDVLWAEDSRYSGRSNGPAGDAAFEKQPGGVLGRVAVDREGQDGNTWNLVDGL